MTFRPLEPRQAPRNFGAFLCDLALDSSFNIRNNLRASRVLMPEGRQREWTCGHEQEGTLMGIIVWLVIGGIVGWLASLIMRTDAQQGVLLNIVVGIVGAVIAGLIFVGGNINAPIRSISAFLLSLLGAVILLAIVNLVRRGIRPLRRGSVPLLKAARERSGRPSSFLSAEARSSSPR